ncbi:MAG: sensor histidine kinase [Lewinella sp.]|uniref:sensor histidine kinase n=1 Tax=Lewinella sp. TaxID=2004506 RepID=UPI003D6C3A13
MHAIKKSAFQLVLCSIMIFPLSSLAIGQVFLSRIDSLEAHVREGQPDTLLYSTLYALTESKAVSNTDSAVAYAKQLIALADHMKAQPQQIEARRLLGDVYRQAGMIDSVEQVVLRAIAQGGNCQKDRWLIREKNQQIEQSLAEKEVLLREIHHRVKNNLQIISGLLDKQARKSSDEAVRQLVREGQERIQSMALIHQNLYESEALSGIDIKAYLQELSKNIQKSQHENTDCYQLELNVAHETLEIDTAIPVGLILNELLTNCYKYAFRGKRRGK